MLVHCHCDKIHRVIRDLKLSAGCDTRFEECLLATTYIFGVNYKPMSSGAFGDEKTALLSAFLESESMEDCAVFQKYKQLICMDFEGRFVDLPAGATPSDTDVWNLVAELYSFVHKSGFPKPSRWFAWHQQAHQQLAEFYATRCLLEWYLGGDEGMPPPEEVSQTFKQSRAELGGLKLLYNSLSHSYHEAAHVLLMVSRPCWTWYSEQVSDIKTPHEGLCQLMEWVHTWNTCQHVIDTVKTMYNWKDISRLLKYQTLQGRVDEEDLATTIFQYASNVLSRRLWTMTRYSTAPECFANLFSTCPNKCQDAMNLIKDDWQLLCMAEQSHACACISGDLKFLFSAPVRLACAVFEQAQWDHTNETGQRLLRSILLVLPDNKVVEDAHQAVRVECKSHPNMKMTISRQQSCVLNSPIFSSRGLEHPALLSKQQFLRQWGKRPSRLGKYSRKTFSPRYHRLPASFSSIMSKKCWTTLSEDQYSKSFAAWHWIRYYKCNFLANSSIRVADAWF